MDKKVPAILDQLGCTLTIIYGIGVVGAMELLVEVGDPHRFRTEAQFARWCGAAPVALSSGEGDGPPRRHRLDLGGNRNVNSILHTIHVTQIRCYQPAQAYTAKNGFPAHASCPSLPGRVQGSGDQVQAFRAYFPWQVFLRSFRHC